ncbi:MAG TPA: pilus assembly protein TadG-related protein [Candidatus Limnocylindrales bacterium]|nr:pilus assembly protein TadG-related protein [Candidatus Limnocylindrales bacterium]
MSSSINGVGRATIARCASRFRPRPGGEGQVVVLFALALLVILGVTALVFDVGQNFVDRRKEQDVADAAALAAARYIQACPAPQSAANCPAAVNAAVALASSQGYVDGQASVHVTVKIPPGPETEFAGIPGTVEVNINSTRGSFFSGVFGMTSQGTGALAVAQNSSGYTLPYSLLALDPTSCGTNKITGTGGVTVGGTVHVDSNCSSQAVLLSGQGVLTAPECDVVGQVQTSGGATDNCATTPSGVTVFGDPLRELPAPPLPGAPAAVVKISGGNKPIPAGCPGSNTPATAASPAACAFPASYSGYVFRLYPGFYPGGLNFAAGTFYLEPGIYWLGGGGYTQNGSGATVTSVAAGGTTLGGGVLFYLSQDPDPTIQAGCTTTPGGPGCFSGWSMNGSAANLQLIGIASGPYENMVLFVDRGFANASVSLNGSTTSFSITGTIYAPTALIKVNGSGATSFSAQIITYDVQVNGSGGSLNIPYNSGSFFHLKGIGLVQ